MKLRMLVVDDTILYRKIVSDVLAKIPEVELIGTACNGRIALERIEALKPDLVTLDIEMPEMNGLDVLKAMKERKINTGVIVLSSLSVKGSELTIRALELGAFDFLTKSTEGSIEARGDAIENGLISLVRTYRQQQEIRSILRGKVTPTPLPAKQDTNLGSSSVADRMSKITSDLKPEMVVIGISTGGPNALADVLPQIPADLGVPILIVQHMPPLFTQSLAQSLDGKSTIRVKEAQDKEALLANTAYIAPGGKQMKVVAGFGGTKVISITDDPPENNCKPSVDYLFRSVAHNFPGRASAVIMTGMGNDGTMGLRLLKRNGCFAIAQDAASCVVFGMPKEAINAGVIDLIVPLPRIAEEICRTVKRTPK